jgi:hypothetical protein
LLITLFAVDSTNAVGKPRRQRAPEKSSEEPIWQALSMLPTITMILDGELSGAEEQLASMPIHREQLTR